jgi:hypothetical protein
MATRTENQNRLLDRVMLALKPLLEFLKVNIHQTFRCRRAKQDVDYFRPVTPVNMCRIELATSPAVLARSDGRLLLASDLLNQVPKERTDVPLELFRCA